MKHTRKPRRHIAHLFPLLSACLLLQAAGCAASAADAPAEKPKDPAREAKQHDAKDSPRNDAKDDKSISLFDGKELGKWQKTNFGGEGDVAVKDGAIVIDAGSPMSGITWKGEVPMTMNYEITLEAQRVEGDDFFLGLTVPVGKDSISLICGGWGGTLVGLSSLDGMDASENETTQFVTFKNKQWYKIRLRVMEKKIQAWIDDKKIVDADTADRRIGVRIEVEPSIPLGIATYSTKGAYRNIKMMKIDQEKK
jgi:hypothetical protein